MYVKFPSSFQVLVKPWCILEGWNWFTFEGSQQKTCSTTSPLGIKSAPYCASITDQRTWQLKFTVPDSNLYVILSTKGTSFYCITSIQSMKGITQFLVSQMHNFVCLASINKDWSLEIFSNYFRKINFFIVKLRMEIMLTDTMKIDICRQSMDS